VVASPVASPTVSPTGSPAKQPDDKKASDGKTTGKDAKPVTAETPKAK